MPALRLEFPFLMKERWLGRAKRTVRSVKNPLLVNSYKAHLASVNSLTFISTPKILIRYFIIFFFSTDKNIPNDQKYL